MHTITDMFDNNIQKYRYIYRIKAEKHTK